MPPAEVARAVENGAYRAAGKHAALNDGIDGLQDVGGIEFERPGDEQLRGLDVKLSGEVDEMTMAVNGQRLGIGID